MVGKVVVGPELSSVVRETGGRLKAVMPQGQDRGFWGLRVRWSSSCISFPSVALPFVVRLRRQCTPAGKFTSVPCRASLFMFFSVLCCPFCSLLQASGYAKGGRGQGQGARLVRLEPAGKRLRQGLLRHSGQVKSSNHRQHSMC